MTGMVEARVRRTAFRFRGSVEGPGVGIAAWQYSREKAAVFMTAGNPGCSRISPSDPAGPGLEEGTGRSVSAHLIPLSSGYRTAPVVIGASSSSARLRCGRASRWIHVLSVILSGVGGTLQRCGSEGEYQAHVPDDTVYFRIGHSACLCGHCRALRCRLYPVRSSCVRRERQVALLPASGKCSGDCAGSSPERCGLRECAILRFCMYGDMTI